MPRIIVFDVNEPLLDIGTLEPHFVRTFGDPLAVREWFHTVLLYSEVLSLAGPSADFSALGDAALEMIAASREISASAENRRTHPNGHPVVAAAPGRARQPASTEGGRLPNRHAHQLRTRHRR